MTTYLDLQVDPTDLHTTRVVEQEPVPLQPGQVRFRVDEFALTANNITYAAMGAFLGYLDFFPVGDDPWRRIPVMGHGDLVESAHPDIPAGGRYFGFFPMAGEHVVTAEPRGTAVWDAGAHRQKHAATYRSFENVRSNPHYDAAREPHVALLRGLFITSWLVDDFLADSGDFDAQQVLITSASSKTSIALGWCLQRRGVPTVALTSSRHRTAVEGLGCYDRVLAYDQIASLDAAVPSAVVDMAGNGEVLGAIHRRFADRLRLSCIVGATHRDVGTRPTDLPGANPEFFFAPAQIEKRAKDWGAGEVMRRAGEAFATFVEFSDTWLHVEHSRGADAARRAYLEVLDGQSAPTTGHVVSLRDE